MFSPIKKLIGFFNKKSIPVINEIEDDFLEEDVLDLKSPSLTRDELLTKYLIEVKGINPKAVQAAKMEHDVSQRDIGSILVRNGFIRSADLVEALTSITPGNLVTEERILQKVPPEIVYQHKVKFHAETISHVYVSTLHAEDEVTYAIKEYFPSQEIFFIEADADGIESYISTIQTIHDSETSALEKMIRDAINLDASDIHMFTRYETYTVMYRIDGVTSIVHEGEISEFKSIAARIKDRGKMDMAESRKPQDGGFDIDYNGRIVSLRVSISPLNVGEAIVLRILDPERNNQKITDLGITDLKLWMNGCRRLEGLNLVCGATGSGKTTTLSASIRELDRFGKVIYTAEDPVENQIPFVRQVNLNELVGLDFSRALKSFMRMDPDIIMIGEIRDIEAARNAIKAAETGHLVLSTLHTGSILGAVGRMRDLGVPIYELKSVLRSVMAQTLIRKICTVCKNKKIHSDHEARCHNCLGIGYKGRTLVTECYYFKSEEEVEEVMTSKKPKWKTILQDAMDKYKAGITDEKELIRVFGPEAEDALEAYKKEHAEKKNNSDE